MIIFVHVNDTAWLLLIVENCEGKNRFATGVFAWFILLRNQMLDEPFEVAMLELEAAEVSGGDRTAEMMIIGV